MNRPATPDSDDGDHNADNAPTNGPIRVVDEHWARPVPGTPELIRPATPPDRMQLSFPDQTPPAEAPEAPRRRGGNSLMTLRDLERVNYKPFFRRQSRRYVQRRVQRASVLTTVDIHN
nr:uncharacterized protein LOC126056013 [Helicoverpa armigera]